MKRQRSFIFLFVFICFVSSPVLSASDGTHFDMSGFPRWAQDLRRGEIIAFGAFPFAYFFSNWAFDFYRYANHDWDRRYAPFPLAAPGSIGKTQSEMISTLWIAAGVSVVFALVDHGIMRARRNRIERDARSLPEGAPIIIRRSMYEDETDISGLESPGTEAPAEAQ
jgi:hypothetical protein